MAHSKDADSEKAYSEVGRGSESREHAINSPPTSSPVEKNTQAAPIGPTPPANSDLLCLASVFAAWLLFFNAWGPTLSYGLFQDFYLNNYLSSYSASTIAWIGALNAFLLVVTGVVAGPLFDRGYLRHLMAAGCFLSVFGTMMLSLSTEYYQIMLSQGICMGIGNGLVYVPALAMVGRLFTKQRSIAIGIVTTGASIGGVIIPIVFLRLQPTIGFPWAIRVIGYIQLFCVVVALAILLQLSLPPAGKARQFIHWHAFKQVSFSSYFISGFLIFMSYLVPLVFLSPYSVEVLKQSPETAYYQLAVSNAASAFGRLGSAYVAPKVGPSNTLIFSLTSSCILIFAWIAVQNSAGFWAWCAVWGLCSGVIISINPVVVAHPAISHSPAVLGTRLGMQWFSTSFGLLVGIPIAGALLTTSSDIRTSYMYLQIFGGAIMFAALAFFMPPWYAIRKRNQEDAKSSSTA